MWLNKIKLSVVESTPVRQIEHLKGIIIYQINLNVTTDSLTPISRLSCPRSSPVLGTWDVSSFIVPQGHIQERPRLVVWSRHSQHLPGCCQPGCMSGGVNWGGSVHWRG